MCEFVLIKAIKVKLTKIKWQINWKEVYFHAKAFLKWLKGIATEPEVPQVPLTMVSL